MTMIRFKSLYWCANGDRQLLARQTKLGLDWRVSVHLTRDVKNKPAVEFTAERVRHETMAAALLHQGGDLETAIAYCDADFVEQSLLLIREISGDQEIVGKF